MKLIPSTAYLLIHHLRFLGKNMLVIFIQKEKGI